MEAYYIRVSNFNLKILLMRMLVPMLFWIFLIMLKCHIQNLPENMLAVESIPHTWLIERVSAVCHHGGAGTTALGFKAGVPSVIIPFSNDQFAWAHRAYSRILGKCEQSSKMYIFSPQSVHYVAL